VQLIFSAVTTTEVRLSNEVVIGSDETHEGHPRHKATHLLCIQHLKDNATDYMRNKCGVLQSVHTYFTDMLFSILYSVLVVSVLAAASYRAQLCHVVV